MRGSFRRLKERRRPADATYMTPGGCRRFRRRLAPLVIAGSLAVLLLPTAGVAAANTPPPPPTHGILAGDTDGGPPPPTPYVSPGMQARRDITWSDMSSYGWAKPAVNYVAAAHAWMLDYQASKDGTYRFHPGLIESRKYFARALVKAFAPGATVDPSIKFDDLRASTPFYKWANITQQKGWLRHDGSNDFNPDKPTTMAMVHKALVSVLADRYPKLHAAVKNLDSLHTADGYHFKIPHDFATTLIGQRIYLRYNNNSVEAKDVNPHSQMSRAQVAYSLYMAATAYAAPSGSSQNYTVNNVATQYASMELPHLGPKMIDVVQWGIRYVGYPYIWAGEWGFKSREPSGLGGQPVPGFDCSGLTWWLLRHDDGGVWNISPPRPYQGWDLPQRSSADMANAGNRVKFGDLHAGDIMFYDWDHNGVVDHVDTYVGGGWALDSSSGVGGVTFMWVGSGAYADNFTHGRTII
jgi:cell wall-associated NlpC family hydrolase